MSTQVKNMQRFRCNECDYDLCDDCHRNGIKAAGGQSPAGGGGPRMGFARMSDPEGDRGLYWGPLDEQD
eukprot:15465372-Alexandrium_andersonii.AAC.1